MDCDVICLLRAASRICTCASRCSNNQQAQNFNEGFHQPIRRKQSHTFSSSERRCVRRADSCWICCNGKKGRKEEKELRKNERKKREKKKTRMEKETPKDV
jgi:hypothetical protein